MTYNPEIHHRRSIRLHDFDYASEGAYFVTICTHDRECLFGEIVNSEMRLNDAGQMVHRIWDDLAVKYSDMETDEFIVMPNHFHGIILIVGAGPRACPGCSGIAIRPGIYASPESCTAQTQKQGQAPVPAPTGLSLTDVVHRFKSFTTAEYRNGVRQKNWPPFNGKIWQRNYYEHIIRNEDELHRIREYISNNPLQWDKDENNLNNISIEKHA